MSGIDIILDLETLGTDDDAVVIQIGASCFDIKTGELLKDGNKFTIFNKTLDISSLENVEVSTSTLQFWTSSESNLQTFKSLLHRSGVSNIALWKEFHYWLTEIISNHPNEEVKIWGNGIIFDIQKIKRNFEKHDLVYPIKFYNERDCRTLVEMASRKLGITDREFKNSIPNDNPHDALADIIWEAKYLSKAYNTLIK